jgi:hypothetical protein
MMSIISKLVNTTTPNQNQLSKEELEFLLYVLKSTNIVGEQVEMFYNLVLKLQNQYVEQTKK